MRLTSPNKLADISFTIIAFLALIVGGCSHEVEITKPLSADKAYVSDAPTGYYDSVNDSNPSSLRATLHELIDDHSRIPYTDSSTDTWDVLELACEDPNNSGHVLDVYRNASYIKHGGGNTDYNREHSWPSSFGFGDNGSSNYPYTDCHHLFICNDSYNSSRSNKPYGSVGSPGTEYITEVNNGVGGGSGSYPGWSNWATPTYWETWMDRRGDVARAILYMDVRYEGGVHGVTGASEPDLIVTNNLSLIEGSNTGNNEPVAYMGLLSVLLQWNIDDPVDAKEMLHNDTAYAAQGNRNPFVDHPEWIDCIFVGTCGGVDITAPEAPTSFVAYAGNESIDLDWADNQEADLAGYTIYRATSSGGPYNQVNTTLHSLSSFYDVGLTNNIPYFYLVTATDLSGNESFESDEATATPDPNAGGGTGDGIAVFINEFHYDNTGIDTGEFLEIAGPSGTNLAGWRVIGYNGNGGGIYDTEYLSGFIPEQMNGMGTIAFDFVAMQNGSPDALALVNEADEVVLFISYEGTLVASDGPAAGMTSVNIEVVETAETPVGHSLQLGGTGSVYEDFTWESPQVRTYGEMNVNQIFTINATIQTAWINEIHYENVGTDSGEFVEIAGTAQMDLSGWSIVAYSGADGLVYQTLALSGLIKEQEAGVGTKGFLMPGLQNDSEGLALVDNFGHVQAFISYEGSFTAMDGPAMGMTADDIGLGESADTPLRHSLQLMGEGRSYRAFHWSEPAPDTANRMNVFQRFDTLEVELNRE